MNRCYNCLDIMQIFIVDGFSKKRLIRITNQGIGFAFIRTAMILNLYYKQTSQMKIFILVIGKIWIGKQYKIQGIR